MEPRSITLNDIASIEYVNEQHVYDLTVEHNGNYYLDYKRPILVHNSGKTYSILQFMLYVLGFEAGGQILSIVRSNQADLRITAMRDFLKILEVMGHYNESAHHKSTLTYSWNTNTFEFLGMDKSYKKKSARRDHLYLNEGNSLGLEDWFQLSVRTRGMTFIDWNPTETDNWIIEHVLPRDDCKLIHSTYLDNYDFLSQKEIDNIEYWKGKDDYYWDVYGLGIRADITGLIFPNTNIVEDMPEEYKLLGYWMDFGFSNHPTSIGKLGLQNGELWADELVYDKGLTNVPPLVNNKPDMLDAKNIHYHLRRNGIPNDAKIIADSAEPKSIEELYRMGWNIHPAPKGPDSIKAGIDIVKRYPVNITRRSVGLIKEAKMYKWAQDKYGNELQKPVDRYNHSWDGIRYVCLSEIGEPKGRIIDVDVV